jgi:hypothetical protein
MGKIKLDKTKKILLIVFSILAVLGIGIGIYGKSKKDTMLSIGGGFLFVVSIIVLIYVLWSAKKGKKSSFFKKLNPKNLFKKK